MLCCKSLKVQRRTVWTRTRQDLRAELDQDELLSLRANAQSMHWSIVQVKSIILVLVLLGTLVSVDGILMEDQEELLVELHNRYRGVVQPSASAMMPLKWDGNLKLVAEGYAAKCIWNHNPELEDSGENLFAGTGELDLERAVEKWFLERLDYNYDNNSCDEDKMCGHYTQMVWADTHRVGCAVHLCAQMEGLDWTEPTHFLVCNYYPPGNFEGERPYVEGEWCSQCPEKLQRCENNLCAPDVEPTEAESLEDLTETEVSLDLPSPSDGTESLQDLHTIETVPGTDPTPLLEQEQDPVHNTDQGLQDHVEQEAVVPPPATESFPPEPLTTAQSSSENTDTVTESIVEAVPETGSKTEPETRPEPEDLQPKSEIAQEDPTGGPAGGAVVRTEQELKVPSIGGKAQSTHLLTPLSHPQTPPPENRGQKQKDIAEKHRRAEKTSDCVVLSGSWILVFLWIGLQCL